jgi:hypothetical protein
VKQPPLSFSAVKAAMAAGVKPAALVTHERIGPKPLVKPIGPPVAVKEPSAKPTLKGKPAKASHKPAAKWVKQAPPKKWGKHPPPAAHVTTHATHVATVQRVSPTAKKKPSPAIAKNKDSEGSQ